MRVLTLTLAPDLNKAEHLRDIALQSPCGTCRSLLCRSGKYLSLKTLKPNHASRFRHTCLHSPEVLLQHIPYNRICICAGPSSTHTQSDLPLMTMFFPVPACLPAVAVGLTSGYLPDSVSSSSLHAVSLNWLRYTSPPTPCLEVSAGHRPLSYEERALTVSGMGASMWVPHSTSFGVEQEHFGKMALSAASLFHFHFQSVFEFTPCRLTLPIYLLKLTFCIHASEKKNVT